MTAADSAVPVAPNAFTLLLEDGTESVANAGATSFVTNGCTSMTLPANESRSCVAVFLVLEDAAAPMTLEWSDGEREVTAAVPSL